MTDGSAAAPAARSMMKGKQARRYGNPDQPARPLDSARSHSDDCERNSANPEGILDHAAALVHAKRPADAESWLRKATATPGCDARVHVALGKLLREAGRGDEALKIFQIAQSLDPTSLAPAIYSGLVMMDRHDHVAAVAAFQEVVKRSPDIGEHHRLLGVAFRFAKDFERAGPAFENALKLAPKDPAAWVALASFQEEANRPGEALATLQNGIAAVGAHRYLVEAAIKALRRRGRYGDAAAWIERLLVDNELVAWLHLQLALTIQGYDRTRANVHFARAQELDPEDPKIVVAYAESLNRTRGPKEAEYIAAAYRLARHRLDMRGDLRPDTRALMGIFLRNADFESIGRLGSFEDLGSYYAENGPGTGLHLLLSQVTQPKHRQLLLEWHRACGARSIEAAARSPLAGPPAPAIVGSAKIRVGLMSSDLRNHPIGYFVQPIAEHYDRTKFEFYAYSWFTGQADETQSWFAGKFDAFRHKAHISDRDAAQMISNDRLDVLFDLGGSTDMNKLSALAWRPAPRIASWLGYPHSAGLATIDRIVTDPFIEPTSPGLLLEKSLKLARSWVAFEKPGLGVHVPIDPVTPQERTGQLTFGTMNNPVKYNPEVLATWAKVLRRAHGSRFLFVRPEGAAAPFRDHIEAQFEANGVSRDRISFVPVRGQHLPFYNEIDVALDTFPQTGGTTTCETLWMGVPTVTLAGEAFFERLSYSNLANSGLGKFVTRSRAAYVDKAIAVARDAVWRTDFRRTIRDRLRSAPLGDVRGFAADFQDAIETWMNEPRP